MYESRLLGSFAFGWLVAFIGVLVASSAYEAMLLIRHGQTRLET